MVSKNLRKKSAIWVRHQYSKYILFDLLMRIKNRLYIKLSFSGSYICS